MSANSGIKWIDETFDVCVKLLFDVADIIGISYEEINVWIFCVIWPILTLIMFAEILRLRLKISTKNEGKYY
ncbi:hypothetical protein N9O69_03420 [Alphaproteobacteria bacterium]|nr:hypothetical protein [Alphaproteobacteria bacterium]